MKFGPSGNEVAFYEAGNKQTLQAPAYLNELGLTAYEYSFGRGITLGMETAGKIGIAMKEAGITLSVHAPYFINLASEEEEKRQNSIMYLLSSARMCNALGGTRVVFHPGSCAKMERSKAMELALPLLHEALDLIAQNGLEHITLCPETMGKKNQLGDLEEVLVFCKEEPSLLPTIDFGHLHARDLGAIQTKGDFAAILDTMENAIGSQRAMKMHVHYSRIEFTAMGEKRHHDFTDTQFGPDPALLMPLLKERGYDATIICESRNTQATDAATMKRLYDEG